MKNKWLLAVAGVLTLGLAPFFPEPHFFGKIQWILGGGIGMNSMDYFDFLLHGAPWFYLTYLIVILSIKKLKLKGKHSANFQK